MTGRVLTCVYCGHEYPQGTPAAGHQILTDHIKVCEKHPMRDAEIKIGKLRKALGDLIGAHEEMDLRELERGLEITGPSDPENWEIAREAIDAMRASAPCK